MKTLLALLLLLNFAYAEFIFDDTLPPSQEEVIDYDSVDTNDTDTIPPEELQKNSTQILQDVIKTKDSLNYSQTTSKDIYPTILKQAKKVLLNQRTKLVLKAVIARDDVENIVVNFKQNQTLKVLNPSQAWTKTDANKYKATYYLKYTSLTPTNESAKIEVTFSDKLKNSSSIMITAPKVIKLQDSELFCGVMANDLTIISHSEKKYDDSHLIVLMEVNSTLSNIEDFMMPTLSKSGVDEYIDSGESQKAYLYAIVDRKQKDFKFSYFNLLQNKYNIITFKIEPKDQTLSTQTELNPTKNRYTKYKTATLILMLFLLLFFVVKSKSYILAVLTMILFIYVVYTNIPFKSITLKKGEGLRILPTENSTVFFICSKDTKAVIAYENKNYYKVILPDNTHIGWIKKDDK